MNDGFGEAQAGDAGCLIASLLPASIASAEIRGDPPLPALQEAEGRRSGAPA